MCRGVKFYAPPPMPTPIPNRAFSDDKRLELPRVPLPWIPACAGMTTGWHLQVRHSPMRVCMQNPRAREHEGRGQMLRGSRNSGLDEAQKAGICLESIGRIAKGITYTMIPEFSLTCFPYLSVENPSTGSGTELNGLVPEPVEGCRNGRRIILYVIPIANERVQPARDVLLIPDGRGGRDVTVQDDQSRGNEFSREWRHLAVTGVAVEFLERCVK